MNRHLSIAEDYYFSSPERITNFKSKIVAAINHDPKAIDSHKSNFPSSSHGAPGQPMAWSELECSNFSRKKK